jgi:hypothetical protein
MAISIGSAVGTGFGLVRRKPVTVMSWGFFLYLAIFILLAIGVAIVGLPLLAKLGSLNGATPDNPAQSEQIAMQILILLWPALLLVVIGSVVVSVMVQAATIRSILEPDTTGFANLRLGGAEGALALLALLCIPVMIVVFLISALVLGGLFAAGKAIHGWTGGLLVFFGCVAYGVAFMWVALRFSLAAPMTFAERRVRFFGSWTLTKGEGWSLFGLAWVMVAVSMGVTLGYSMISGTVNVIFTGGAMASVMGSSGAGGTPDPNLLLTHWPVLVAAYIPSFLLGAAFNGVMQAISMGPWVDVYRQLTGARDVAKTFS